MKKTLLVLFILLFLPLASFGATTKLEFSAWVPYWKKTAAITEAQANLSKLTTIMPFSYEVRTDGTVWDPMKITKEPWASLIASARAKNVKIIPSILWNNGTAIQKVLATKKSRDAHIKQISDIVKNNNWAGIDIDYEGKTVASFNTFAAFIRDLSISLHKDKKILSCTIEPRLPPTSRFLKVPEEIQYANDYAKLNKYCDEIRIMAYDQMTADILLNKRKKSLGYYTPVADLDFVKKLVAYASHQISPTKIVLGVANYGYAYQVIDKGTYYDYKKLSALTYKTFTDLAKSTGSTPVRNTAGELSFTYYKTVPPTSNSGETKQTRFATLSDSVAIASKIKLANSLGLKGVTLFKIDGESDPGLWEVFK
ncbi:MAG: glycosyl hydrolase family 18 protein [Candidatus Paceibacterota bacterium]|jgi:spore germination protein YaaH